MGVSLRVLIVEDSEDDAALLVRHLRQGGYDPVMRRVETSRDMSKPLQEQTWDIVISDHSMPYFSASAALALLQESGLDIPFIIVSGVIGEEAAVAAMRAGAHDYVMNGNLARLIPAIERELRDAEKRREDAALQLEKNAHLARGRRRLEAFQEAVNRLALAKYPTEALQDFVDTARELIEARYGALVVWDNQSRVDRWVVSGLSAGGQLGTGGPPKGIGLLSLVRDRQRSVRLKDIPVRAQDGGLLPSDPPMKSFLGIPILFQGRSAGALYLIDSEQGVEFTDYDERMLNVFGVLSGVLMDNASLYEQVTRERSILAAVQGSMTEGLVVIGSDGRVVYFNEAAKNMLLFASETALGSFIEEVLGTTTLDVETEDPLKSLLDMLREGVDGPVVIELELLRPELCQLSIAIFPITDCTEWSEDTMTGLVVRDVTQERELERRRDTFVSVASHELRTPLTTLQGFAELLLVRDPPQGTRRKWLNRIHQDSQRLASLVDEMLNVSRIQSGKLTVNLENVVLQSFIEEVIEGVSSITDKHKFMVDIPPDLPPVSADRHKLAQVLVNLVDNAGKYSPDGGLITISAYLEQASHRIVTIVSDQGIGISPEDQRELFSTFRRIRQPETESIGGTGLGLYIVKGLVELMHGEVWVESTVGEGSTFLFSIPATGEPLRESRQE